MADTIISVSRWADVFETAESRRYKQLTWIAIPVSFNSTGLQRMLDDFDGTTAAALYGCWNALLKIAATAPTRGVLAGQKGEPYTAGRLARLSGFPKELFETLIDWCLSVGWLVATQSAPELPDRTEPDRTEPDRTEPNRTGPDRTGQNRTKPDETAPTPESGPARPGGTFFLNALQTKFPDKPELLQLIQQPVRGLADDKTPTQPRQCWTGCGWDDGLISRLADVMQRPFARDALFDWHRRQLAAPDPVAPDPTAAGAICVLALAETAAKRPGLKSRVGWFRTQLERGNIDEIAPREISAAAKYLAGRVEFSFSGPDSAPTRPPTPAA